MLDHNALTSATKKIDTQVENARTAMTEGELDDAVTLAELGVATWIFGLMLAFTPGIVDWSALWPYTKLAAILAMTWFHHWLGRRRKDFAAGTNSRTGRTYRMMNELPTLLLVVIVISIVVRPF